MKGHRAHVVLALAALYLAQGIPFGFATEYLPVVLRESGMSYTGIASTAWLQSPWQLKIFWATAADHKAIRAHTRFVILGMQLALAATVAAFALKPLREAPTLWFVLTFVAAAVAATQDIFVDAYAVRVLRPDERGFGNTAQVAGYRLGMLTGGGALLLLAAPLGERAALGLCAAVIVLASIGAFLQAKDASATESETRTGDEHHALRVRELARHVFRREARPVLWLALTFKLGLHMATPLLKPMVFDYGWSKQQIGSAVVTVGLIAGLIGAAVGGALHRILQDARALGVAIAVQTLACAPLIVVERLHAPFGFTTAAIALEHFASGVGTTILFAALMTATRPAEAGLHYTFLTSANVLAIGFGGQLGALCADRAGKLTAFIVATVVCAIPALFLNRFGDAVRASRDGQVIPTS